MLIKGVLESCLYAHDLEAAEEFYTGILGLKVISHDAGRHVFFLCGEGVMLVFNPERTSSVQTEVGGAIIPRHGSLGPGHLAFNISEDDLPGWRELLMQNGVAIESEVDWPQGGASIYVRDPAGNSIELASARMWGLNEG